MHHLTRLTIGILLASACLASATADDWAPLFDGKTLDGWKQINGTATYHVEDGMVVGKTNEGSPNSFLCTTKPYGDFELQFEVLCDPDLNSGVQIRSNSLPDYQNGRVHGYQVEIEEGEAGYIYDEARRGWLSPQQPKTDVFKKGEWNSFRVVCQGDRIRTWINGEPIEDLKDDMTPSGFIGLQVHGVARGSGPYQVRWRKIRIREIASQDAATQTAGTDDGWVSLFNGKNLDGWKVNENKDSVVVQDGMIVVKGPRSHAFYAGPVAHAQFKNFEFMADVMTTPGSNSGIYFHTQFQPSGWPDKGYEAQVNNTHGDPKKTGGLYDVKDNYQAPAKDNEWFHYHIMVEGKHVVVKINGKTITDYTEPEDVDRPDRRLGTGTFAFQAHDPKSVVYYKNIKVKVLPD